MNRRTNEFVTWDKYWKYDRLAKNLSDQTELVKNFSKLNIRVLSVTENNEDNRYIEEAFLLAEKGIHKQTEIVEYNQEKRI